MRVCVSAMRVRVRPGWSAAARLVNELLAGWQRHMAGLGRGLGATNESDGSGVGRAFFERDQAEDRRSGAVYFGAQQAYVT